MSKSKYIHQMSTKKGPTSIHGYTWVYKRVPPRDKDKERKKDKARQKPTSPQQTIPTNPQLHPNQVKKSTKDLDLSIMYTFDQDQRLQMKETSSFELRSLRFQKRYCSFQAKWTTKEPSQERRVSLMNNGNTHFKATIAKRSSQITLVCGQCNNS